MGGWQAASMALPHRRPGPRGEAPGTVGWGGARAGAGPGRDAQGIWACATPRKDAGRGLRARGLPARARRSGCRCRYPLCGSLGGPWLVRCAGPGDVGPARAGGRTCGRAAPCPGDGGITPGGAVRLRGSGSPSGVRGDCSKSQSPATVSEVARAGRTLWRRHLAAVPRRGFSVAREGRPATAPWDWRARDLGSREDVGIRTKMLRGVLEPMDSSTERENKKSRRANHWAALRMALMGQ